MANVPFLTPTPYTPPQATPAPTPSSNDVKDLIDYLNKATERPENVSYMFCPLKKFKKEIDRIFEERKKFKVEERNSALDEFAKVYTIDGKLGYDAESFLDGARQNMTKVLRDNRNTKVKLIYRCNMQMLKTNGIKAFTFHSDIEVNLDGTGEKELYDIMVERILEKIATFLATKSETRFYSVIKFELHTVSYEPLRGETYIPLPKEMADKKAIINMKNKDK